MSSDDRISSRLRLRVSPGTVRAIEDQARRAPEVRKRIRRDRWAERASSVVAGTVVAGAVILMLCVVVAAIIGVYALARAVFS